MLIYYPNGDRETEVYCLTEDPDELANLRQGGHPLAENAIAMVAEHARSMSSAEKFKAIDFNSQLMSVRGGVELNFPSMRYMVFGVLVGAQS